MADVPTDADSFRHSDGNCLLGGYPRDEPAAFVVIEDSYLLRREFEGVFKNISDETVRRNDNVNGTAVSGNGVLRIEKAQR